MGLLILIVKGIKNCLKSPKLPTIVVHNVEKRIPTSETFSNLKIG